MTAEVSMPFSIGSIRLANGTILAPLAGITNLPMRLLCKAGGAGLVCSEMISANGLVRGSAKTAAMLRSAPAERPLSVQIFGADPVVMAEAARMVAEAGADIVDLNFGCSVRKVVKTGAGVALMRDPRRAEAVLKAVRRAVSIPLTVKMRSGWTVSGEQALEIATIAEGCGVDAVIIHPRTAGQGFSGHADWPLIGRIRERTGIPVVGNGDIVTPEDGLRMRRETGCAAVMIGRAAMGNPWIFGQIDALWATGAHRPVTPAQRRLAMHRYVSATVAEYGETVGCRLLRSRLGWFVRGLRGGSRFRERIKHLEGEAEALAVIDGFFDVTAAGQTFGGAPD
ncbi:MAG: tRNA dihydrouridine synthase DusB [Desulfobacteraceae bacterium]|nr:tRNA dihydrouridine synthase DusB [Desulfobacteraceae bacterium]